MTHATAEKKRNFKAVAAGRKNYLFLGRETAGPTTAILYTIRPQRGQPQPGHPVLPAGSPGEGAGTRGKGPALG